MGEKILESLASDLNLVLPFVSDDLVSTDARKRILDLGETIPANCVAQFGFESWLGVNEPRLDFLFKTGPAISQRQSLSQWISEFETSEKNRWKPNAAFWRAWSEEGSELWNQVQDIWTEFDIPESGILPVPGLFFGTHENQTAGADARELEWIIREALALLFDSALPPEVCSTLRHCFRLIPRGIRLFNVGVIPGRETRFIRLCFCDFKAGEINQFLKDLNWNGSAPLRDRMMEWEPFANSCVLDIDVWDGILPKVGIEYYIWDRMREHRHKWNAFLQRLVDTGLATARETQGLQAWRGICHQSAHPLEWPERLTRAAALVGLLRASVFERSLHHVKISFENGIPSRAKAYLSAKHVWADTALQNPLQTKEASND